LKDIDFVVVGAAAGDIIESFKYSLLSNVHFAGYVVDDAQLAAIYRNAFCVVCPILAPSFPSRFYGAFFYKKVVISTRFARACFAELRDGSNILLAKSAAEAAELVRRVFNEVALKVQIEEHASAYYAKYFSPRVHCSGIEEVLECVRRQKAKRGG
jgi:glycosyltransferase involved in cell wall biosynthesis